MFFFPTIFWVAGRSAPDADDFRIGFFEYTTTDWWWWGLKSLSSKSWWMIDYVFLDFCALKSLLKNLLFFVVWKAPWISMFLLRIKDCVLISAGLLPFSIWDGLINLPAWFFIFLSIEPPLLPRFILCVRFIEFWTKACFLLITCPDVTKSFLCPLAEFGPV